MSKELGYPKPKGDGIRIRGFFRVHIEDGESGKIVGDSGWVENTITNNGKQDYLCALLGDTTDSKQVGYMALGTGTAINATHDTLDGEVGASVERKAVAVSLSQSTKVRFTATFHSTDSFIGATTNIRNIGLFNNNASNGSIFAGSTYASSQCDTNQNVNTTYDITFG